MKDIEPKKRGCGNCLSWKIQEEFSKANIICDYYYNGTSCSNPLFYLEDLGIIKILQGVPNRESGVLCNKLRIKILNSCGNKI